MFGKIIAGIVMGIIVAILASVLVGLVAGGGENGGRAGLWAMAFGFVITLVLALTAKQTRNAWGRGSLISGLMCLGLPLAGIIFTGVAGSQALSLAESSTASQAGTAVGIGLAGTVITGALAVIGFFAGIIFLVIAYFSLRDQRNSPSA